MRFDVVADDKGVLRGRVIYSRGDYAFDFKASSPAESEVLKGQHGSGSLTIDTLQIEVSVEHARLLYVWGCHPKVAWRRSSLPQPTVARRACAVVGDVKLEAGVGIAIDRERRWVTEHDSSSGWVWCHAPEGRASKGLIEFADNTLAEIKDGALLAIWLRPVIKD